MLGWGSTLRQRGALVIALCLLLTCLVVSGCGPSATPPPKPDAQDRLGKLYNLVRAYVEKNQKGPPNEEALREFGNKLSPEDRSARLIGDDLDSIFTSPRDNKKFVVRYNFKAEPSQNKAVAWEEVGQNGKHFVALSMGYVVEYDDATLAPYTK